MRAPWWQESTNFAFKPQAMLNVSSLVELTSPVTGSRSWSVSLFSRGILGTLRSVSPHWLFPNVREACSTCRPFKDATSQKADKQCSNVENTLKFARFSRPLFLRITRFFKEASMDPQQAKIPTILCVLMLRGVFKTLLYTFSEIFCDVLLFID